MIKIKTANKEVNFISLILFALLAFFTWYFEVKEVYNVILYSVILILLAIFRFSNSTLVIFTIFTIAANRNPNFLETLNGIYNNIFGKNIIALSKYYTFLYSAVFIVLMFILVIRAIINKYKYNSKLLIPLLAILIYACITLFWAKSKVSGLSEIWFILQGYFVYVLTSNDNNKKVDFNKVAWSLALLLVVITLEYFVSYYIFFKDLNIDLTFLNFWQYKNKGPINLWANPNIVAAVFGISFIPSLYKYFSTKSKLKYLFIPFDLLIIYAIILTKTTGLHYAFAIGYIFIPFLLIKDKKYLFITIVAGVLAFIIAITLIIMFQDQVPNIYTFLNEKSTLRLDIYAEAIDSVTNIWCFIFGRGVGYDRVVLNASFFHSWFYQILVTRGIIGIMLTFYVIYLIIEIMYNSKNIFRYFLLLGIIIYQAHALTDSGFDYQFIGVIHFFLIASLEKANGNYIAN